MDVPSTKHHNDQPEEQAHEQQLLGQRQKVYLVLWAALFIACIGAVAFVFLNHENPAANKSEIQLQIWGITDDQRHLLDRESDLTQVGTNGSWHRYVLIHQTRLEHVQDKLRLNNITNFRVHNETTIVTVD